MAQAAIAQPSPMSGRAERARPVLVQSFLWMFLGMGIATFTSWWAIQSGTMNRWASSNEWFWLVSLLIWIAISLAFAPLVQRVPAPVGLLLFAVYAAWTGLSLSLTIQYYTTASVVLAFVAAIALFGSMVIFAIFTKMDLLKYSFYIFAGVVALLVVSLLNWFIFRSAALDWWLALIGVPLFAFSTANGVQQIIRMDSVGDPALRSRLAIIGAMILFTNFVNIFIRLLRLMGRSR
jgi:FtsH-binding integral membrane protein